MTPIELQHLIKDQCDTWLNPMGYSLHFSTPTYLAYSNDTIDLNWPWPLIICKVAPNDCNHRITVDLKAGGNTGLMQITIKDLPFEYPDVKDFISDLRYISNCVQSMRKNPIAQHYIKVLRGELKE